MNRAGWWTIGILALVLVVGAVFFWAPNRGPGTTGERTGFRQNQNTPSGRQISNRPNTSNTMDNGSTVSKRVAAAANQVSGVDNAYAFVTNRTAYVGIVPAKTSTNNSTNNNTSSSNMSTNTGGNTKQIEAKVARTVKTDPLVDRAVVTSDSALVSKIRTISDGLRSGKSLADFNAEMKDIKQRMTPTAG